MRLVRYCLQVKNLAQSAKFYRSIMGMGGFSGRDTVLGYDKAQCLLELRAGATMPCAAGRHDFYWKIGITVRDLDAAVRFLREQGWPVSEPSQFRDIGYLCHLRDPDGLPIELLQRRFEGGHEAIGDGHPIGAQATLAHLTLRVTDIDAARELFESALGMRLLSVQPVRDLGFCLYFFGWSDETLPDPALESVANREWLWSRPYALVELQHLEQPGIAIRAGDRKEAGLAGFAYPQPAGGSATYLSASSLLDRLRISRASASGMPSHRRKD